MSKKIIVRAAIALSAAALSALLLGASGAQAAVSVFQNNLAGFNAAAGAPPVAINFDALSGDIAGATISGVTFSSPDGNTLKVVPAASTFTNPLNFTGVFDASTNKLPATSGLNVLSPGGIELVPGPNIKQRDSLQLDFTTAQSAFGLDVLFQEMDCCSFASFAIYDAGLNLLSSGGINTVAANPNNPAGAWFMGFVSSSANISRVVITDSDDNNEFPDSNLGYDTFRFGKTDSSGTPEPATWALMLGGFGLAGAALRRQRRQVIA